MDVSAAAGGGSVLRGRCQPDNSTTGSCSLPYRQVLCLVATARYICLQVLRSDRQVCAAHVSSGRAGWGLGLPGTTADWLRRLTTSMSGSREGSISGNISSSQTWAMGVMWQRTVSRRQESTER